jgi:PAS domain S-box-containing protein
MPEASELEMLARIIEQLPYAMFVKDRSFRYVLVNAALVRMGGLTRDEILGKTDYDFLPKDVADFYREKDTEVFASAAAVNIHDETLIDPEGEKRILSTRKVPLRAPNGEITHLIGVITDVTRLDVVRKERLAVLGQLAGGVAHQIRNPLGAIKNAAYVLQRRVREGGEVAQAIEIIHDEVQRANQIITGLLEYARVRTPVRETTSIADVVERALAQQNVPPEIAVERHIAAMPALSVDGDQLESALSNLLRNSIEAMSTGGTLRIDGELHEHVVLLRISDTGPGIAPDVRARLFEPLVTTKPLGLGLGLVTARTLVEGQGGTLRLLPSEEGTSFEIALPRA